MAWGCLNVFISARSRNPVSLINASGSCDGYLEFAETPGAVNFFYRSLWYEL